MNQRLGLVVVVLGLLAVGVVAGPAAAGDGWSSIQFDPSESTAAPGETTEIDVRLSSHGAPGAGVAEFELIVEYDPDHVTITDVESTGWFEQEDDVATDESLEIDDDTGVINYTETRQPAGDGSTATAPAARLTVDVDEDIAVNETTFSAENSRVLLSNDWTQPVSSRTGTLTIADAASTDDQLPSPVVGGIGLVGALLSVHLWFMRRQ